MGAIEITRNLRIYANQGKIATVSRDFADYLLFYIKQTKKCFRRYQILNNDDPGHIH